MILHLSLSRPPWCVLRRRLPPCKWRAARPL